MSNVSDAAADFCAFCGSPLAVRSDGQAPAPGALFYFSTAAGLASFAAASAALVFLLTRPTQ